MEIHNILEQNIYSPGLEEKFLLIGSCLSSMHPEIVEKFSKEWGNVYNVCLEQTHYNQLECKLANILALRKTAKVGYLTMDGSPHCVQMHYTAKYLKRLIADKEIIFEHYVIREDGKIFKVANKAVDDSKKLALLGEAFVS